MTASSSVRPIALQLLLLMLLPSVAIAQTTAEYCEPSAAVKAELKKVSSVHEEGLPFSARLQKQRLMESTQRLWKELGGTEQGWRAYLVMFEGVGFGNDGEEWMKKAAQAIEKVKGTY